MPSKVGEILIKTYYNPLLYWQGIDLSSSLLTFFFREVVMAESINNEPIFLDTS